jgi:hypothetical protein
VYFRNLKTSQHGQTAMHMKMAAHLIRMFCLLPILVPHVLKQHGGSLCGEVKAKRILMQAL